MQRSQLPTTKAPTDRAARQRIVAAARQHFFAHGFRGVTMADLAAHLGMSKKTLYAHFPGKTDLVQAILVDKFSRLEAEVARITTECAADFLTGLHRLLACVQRHAEEIQPPFVRDIQRETPDLFHLVEERRGEIIGRYFGKVLSEGRREGLIRKDIPLRLIMETLLGAVQAIVNPPKLAELGLTPKSGFTAVITVILEGVFTQKGRSKL